jgi:uncharacterized damage-inducible protein DinB
MENPIPGRPADSEIAPWAKVYVDGVEGGDIVHSLTTQRDHLLAILKRLDGSYRYAPGKWTVCEVLGHVTDAERIFSYRTLCVARGEQGSLPPFEQDDYMANVNFNDRSLADITGEFEAVRDASIRLVRSFTPEAWMRRGTVSGRSVTTRGLAFVLAGHERHHTRILREKYFSA